MRHKQTYKLLTFYKFVDIENPEVEVENHLGFCTDIGIKGRIYIGEEGISATMSLNKGQYQAYKSFLLGNKYFDDVIGQIEQKRTKVDGHQFDKMKVKYRKEIVALGETICAKDIENSYQSISPIELKKAIDENTNQYEILDMRNTYEYKLGHFKNAIPAGTINFREMEELLAKYKERFENKKVVMYCTGGIRCEKLSVLLKKKGFDNFYGLDGGVVNYIQSNDDDNRLGNLYTFDGLVSTHVGDENTHTTIGECIYTGDKTDHACNCRYSPCNARILANNKDRKDHLGFCSQECFDKSKSDLLIKDESRDSLGYKELRGDIKSNKITKEAATELVSSHLNRKLGKKTFNHTTSQKEDIVDQELINKYR